MYRHLAVPVVLLLVAVTGCESVALTESPLSASSTRRADASPTVPFRLVLSGNANPDFSNGPCDVVNSESGTGVAEHLGLVSWTSNEVANFCVDPNDPSQAAVTGTIVITAANGDQLTESYTSTVHADFAAGTLTAAGDYQVTGGTGRFAGATGRGTLDVNGSLAPPFGVSGTYAGTIAY